MSELGNASLPNSLQYSANEWSKNDIVSWSMEIFFTGTSHRMETVFSIIQRSSCLKIMLCRRWKGKDEYFTDRMEIGSISDRQISPDLLRRAKFQVIIPEIGITCGLTEKLNSGYLLAPAEYFNPNFYQKSINNQ